MNETWQRRAAARMASVLQWSALALVSGSLWILLGAAGSGLAAEQKISDTRAVMEKWVETRQITARTRADWIAEKETLTNTLALFQRELADLDETISGVTTNSTAAQQEAAGLEKEKAALDRALAAGAEAASALEKRLLALSGQFPPPLASVIAPSLKKFPENPDETKMDVNTRMRLILGVVNEVDKFNTSINLGTEVQTQADGTELQVQTLYVGLGQAYFVSPNGRIAGVGVPTPQGWEWTPQKDLAPVIQRAIGIYENSLPAAFVGLPVQIK